MISIFLSMRSISPGRGAPIRRYVWICFAVSGILLLAGCSAARQWSPEQEYERDGDHLTLMAPEIPNASEVADASNADDASKKVASAEEETSGDDEELNPFLVEIERKRKIEDELNNDKATNGEAKDDKVVNDEIKLVADEETTDLSEESGRPIDRDPVEENLDNIPAEFASAETLSLLDVVQSVHDSYPALEILYLERQIADGNQLAAWGEFDTKLKGFSENQPTGFYQTYRQKAEVFQPIYHGGEFFGGYRIGRGDFEPWYQERQTNDGGEFNLGVRVPLARNREIDARRAELWRATYERQRVRPEIQSNLIYFVRDASVAYWNWVAAGQQVRVYEAALELSDMRNEKLKRRLETGDLDPPVFQDNVRSLRLREAKLIDRQRKLDQAAVKLSLYYRTAAGDPELPDPTLLPALDDIQLRPTGELQTALLTALAQRPELLVLNAEMRRQGVDVAEARNDLLPNVDTQLLSKQDVGEPTSSKRDKSEFELEAGIYVEVPLQRRKARGKIQASSAKLAQLRIKREFMEDKIVAEVQSAFAGVKAAEARIEKSVEARELAEFMSDVERRKFDLGQSDLLAVFLREQYAIEAADGEIEARLEYQVALADFLAALADDLVPREPSDAESDQQ